MIIPSAYLQKPARIATALVILCCIWLWLSRVHDAQLGTVEITPPPSDWPPVKPVDSTDSQPGESVQPIEPPKALPPPVSNPEPVEDVDPVDPVKPADPVQPTEPAEPSPSASATPDPPARLARVGKVTVAANTLNVGVIHRALKTHELHNARHGYVHHIALNEVVGSLIENDHAHRPRGAWTKPAYLMAILIAELQKPEDQRLKWIYWFDADTVVLNTQTRLEMFLPPEEMAGLDHVDLLIAANWDGLNSGVFALRVTPWSVSFMSAVLAYPIYEQERLLKDRFRDQSAIQFLLEKDESPLAKLPMKSKDRWVKVPIRWFNSLPVNNAFYKNGTWLFGKEMSATMFDDGTESVYDDGNGPEVKPWKVMRGDMIVHFAGSSYVRDSWMGPWVTRAEAELPEWSTTLTHPALQAEIDAFWKEKNDWMVVERAKSDKEEAEKKKERERLEKEKKEKEAAEKKQKEEDEKKKNGQ